MSDAHDDSDRRTERRTVRSDDPSLSPEANRILTEELRAATGSDEVEVPADRPRRTDDPHGGHTGLWVQLSANRMALTLTFAALVVVGAIVSLATGSWWFLPLAIAVHALGTFVVFGMVMRLTTEVEHPSPTAAARLEEEGVGDPDRVFAELVEEFAPDEKGGRGEREGRGTVEALSNDHDERETAPEEHQAESTSEQRSAMTPSQGPSRPVGPGS